MNVSDPILYVLVVDLSKLPPSKERRCCPRCQMRWNPYWQDGVACCLVCDAEVRDP